MMSAGRNRRLLSGIVLQKYEEEREEEVVVVVENWEVFDSFFFDFLTSGVYFTLSHSGVGLGLIGTR